MMTPVGQLANHLTHRTFMQGVQMSGELSVALASLQWEQNLQQLDMIVTGAPHTTLAPSTFSYYRQLSVLKLHGAVDSPIQLQLPTTITELRLLDITQDMLESIQQLTCLQHLELTRLPEEADVTSVMGIPSLRSFRCRDPETVVNVNVT
jgi:hypothetical protein